MNIRPTLSAAGNHKVFANLVIFHTPFEEASPCFVPAFRPGLLPVARVEVVLSSTAFFRFSFASPC